LTVVAAQIVAGFAARFAARFAAGPDRRPGTPWRTVGLAGIGLLPVLPFVVVAGDHAMGVAYPVPLSWSSWWSAVLASIGGEPQRSPLTAHLAMATLALAAIGALRLRDSQDRNLQIYLWCWAVVPPVLLGAAAFARPTLVPRYFLSACPLGVCWPGRAPSCSAPHWPPRCSGVSGAWPH